MRIRLSDRRKSRSTETKDKNTAGYQIPGWDEDDRRRKYDNWNTFSPSDKPGTVKSKSSLVLY